MEEGEVEVDLLRAVSWLGARGSEIEKPRLGTRQHGGAGRWRMSNSRLGQRDAASPFTKGRARVLF